MERFLRIGGITPLTSIDFPGELAAVLYCRGCPWRCRYCHNRHLMEPSGKAVAWDSILDFLRPRRGLLDAVVFSGGEPTAQQALPAAIDAVRAMGFKVGLHTGGSYPERLAAVLPRVDWVGLDIKALPQDYARVTGVLHSGQRAFESLQRVLDSGVGYEVRVTVHPTLMSAERLEKLLHRLRDAGAQQIMLQRCQEERMFDRTLGKGCPAYLDQDRCTADEWLARAGRVPGWQYPGGI